MSMREIIQFFIKYKYQAIFPIAFFEGPIISIISGFLVSRSQLSFLPALIIVFLGDFLSDFIFYLIGRGGRHAMQYIKFLRIPEEKLQKLEDQYKHHAWRTMIVAKMSYGLGIAFMVASGATRLSWKKFIGYVASLNFIRSILLMGIGYYFGKTALRLGPTYIWYYTLAVFIIVPVGYFLFRKKYLS